MTPLEELEQECSHCGATPEEKPLDEWRIGILTCNDCINRIISADQRAREYESDVAPSWFDPTYAGERWDDDY
jgi:hypothetical protein